MFYLTKKWWDAKRKETHVCKISLSCFVNKRYILDNGINSFDYFHKYVRNQ